MKPQIKDLALKAGVGMLGNQKIEEFTKIIATRCIEIVEKFDSNYAIKMIKKEFEIDQNEK